MPVLIVVYVCHKPTSMFTLNSQTMFLHTRPTLQMVCTSGNTTWSCVLVQLRKLITVFHGNECWDSGAKNEDN